MFQRLSFLLTIVSYHDTFVFMDEQLISKNIKRHRLNKGLSLDQLAHLCGLTKGYVSKIENSEKAPPFSTLIKLATALGVDVGLLMAENGDMPEDARICIVRKGEGKEVTTRGTLYGYRYEALAQKKPGKNMEPYILYPVMRMRRCFPMKEKNFNMLSRAPTNFHTETRNTYCMRVIASTSMRRFLIAVGA